MAPEIRILGAGEKAKADETYYEIPDGMMLVQNDLVVNRLVTCPDGVTTVQFDGGGFATVPADCGLSIVPGYEVVAGTPTYKPPKAKSAPKRKNRAKVGNKPAVAKSGIGGDGGSITLIGGAGGGGGAPNFVGPARSAFLGGGVWQSISSGGMAGGEPVYREEADDRRRRILNDAVMKLALQVRRGLNMFEATSRFANQPVDRVQALFGYLDRCYQVDPNATTCSITDLLNAMGLSPAFDGDAWETGIPSAPGGYPSGSIPPAGYMSADEAKSMPWYALGAAAPPPPAWRDPVWLTAEALKARREAEAVVQGDATAAHPASSLIYQALKPSENPSLALVLKQIYGTDTPSGNLRDYALDRLRAGERLVRTASDVAGCGVFRTEQHPPERWTIGQLESFLSPSSAPAQQGDLSDRVRNILALRYVGQVPWHFFFPGTADRLPFNLLAADGIPLAPDTGTAEGIWVRWDDGSVRRLDADDWLEVAPRVDLPGPDNVMVGSVSCMLLSRRLLNGATGVRVFLNGQPLHSGVLLVDVNRGVLVCGADAFRHQYSAGKSDLGGMRVQDAVRALFAALNGGCGAGGLIEALVAEMDRFDPVPKPAPSVWGGRRGRRVVMETTLPPVAPQSRGRRRRIVE
jgi:hypothetical protein